MQGIQQTTGVSARRPYPVRAVVVVVAIVIASFAAGILVGRVATTVIAPGTAPVSSAQSGAAGEQRSLIEFRAGERAGGSSTVAVPATRDAEQRSLIEFRADERASGASTAPAPAAP